MIPRTQRVQSEQLRVLPPAEFAPLLIEKLERVKRDQENKERLERRLAEVCHAILYSIACYVMIDFACDYAHVGDVVDIQ